MKQRPADSSNPGWDLEVTATSNIRKEEEILLSYGERDNDDFLTHYGFVPPRNPHDDVVLFQNMTDLLEWHQSNIGIKVPAPSWLEQACLSVLWRICTSACRPISTLDKLASHQATQKLSWCELALPLPDKILVLCLLFHLRDLSDGVGLC